MKLKYILIPFLATALIACGGEEKEDKEEESNDAPETAETNTDTAATATELPKTAAFEKIMIPSTDSLMVTAELYEKDAALPYMLLCHQARWSRGEYRETAPMFNELGFNCLAIDQRSGGEVNGVTNETFASATEKGLATQYIDAVPDMEAALLYLYNRSGKPVVIVGSSYSSALVLKIAAMHSNKVSAVVSFSPGEYYKDHSVAGWCNDFSVPFWVTSSKEEAPAVTELIKDNTSENKVQFIPELEGDHGARALWEEKESHEEYWTSLKAFLKSL
jgi:pimeloyl-ACP methyl ester carboxylesterase